MEGIGAKPVWIRGEGVAAACCAHLLDQAALGTLVESATRPKVPAVMLTGATQHLLHDVFQRSDIFAGVPAIDKRIVAWGRDALPVTLPHAAVVISEQALLDRIGPQLAAQDGHDTREAGWSILTARPLPASSIEREFGSRIATASAVKLKTGYDAHACWVESLENGWLFLLPIGEQSAWLLSVGDPPDKLLGGSRVVGDQIAEVSASRGKFPAHPRIADPLCGEGWLACGTAALGFDPLCGDGTGNAVREAILASAAVRAIADGADISAVLAHYRARLMGGFKRHLEICQEFYSRGRCGDWWDQELAALQLGIEWSTRELVDAPASRYRLNGFALESLASG
jgi:hypothetical protein